MHYGILVHEANDDVGVAVIDLAHGSEIGAATLDGQPLASVIVINPIPLGHKVALRDLSQDQVVLEYGQTIGRASQAVARGEHVHTHNLHSLRW